MSKPKFKKEIDNYLEKFKRQYFKDIDCEDYWVSDDIGSVLFINDYFFSFDNIKYTIDNSVTEEELFAWYDHILSYGMNNNEQNMPTLKEWWENKDNANKRLKWELELYNKKIIDFTEQKFTQSKEQPTKDGYYIVITSTDNGIYQQAIKFQDGKWMNDEIDKTSIIARTTEPVTIKKDR